MSGLEKLFDICLNSTKFRMLFIVDIEVYFLPEHLS